MSRPRGRHTLTQDTMKRRGFFLAAGIVVLVLVAMYFFFQIGASSLRGPETKSPKIDHFPLKGIHYTRYEHDEKLYTVSVDEIVQRKSRVGPLTVNPVHEIEIINLRIEIDQRGAITSSEPADHVIAATNARRTTKTTRERTGEVSDSQPSRRARTSTGIPPPLRDALERGFGTRQLGLIREVRVRGFILVLLRKGLEDFSISAKRATLSLPTGRATLQGHFSIISKGGQQLSSEMAYWTDERRRTFLIPGRYVLRDRKSSSGGSKAVFVLSPSGHIKQVEDESWTWGVPLFQ